MKALKIFGKITLVLVIILVIILAVGLLFVSFYPSVGKTPNKEKQTEFAKKTELYYDGQFHNKNTFELMTEGSSTPSDRITPKITIPVEKISKIDRASQDDMTVTWLGHSSSLVQMGEQNILIDPVLSERSSPVGFVGPKRFSQLALECENVPKIDVLFLSHDHYDHMDYETIKAIDNKVSHYITPLGVDIILKGWGIDESKLHPLNWWEDITLNGVSYTLTPSQHFTGRNPLKRNATQWGGVYVKNQKHSLYYTGDGGYCDVFEEVYSRFGETELMMADCGQYNLAWATTHMFPSESVKAASDAHAKWYIPIHWGAFVLSNHAWDDPPKIATQTAKELKVSIATPRIGQTVNYKDIASFDEQWWEDYK